MQKKLEKRTKSLINSLLKANVKIPQNKGNLYELYVFLTTIDVLKTVNSQIQIASPKSGFNFRCNPGSVKNSKYSYAYFSKNGKNYELRNGIEVEGYNMHHEVDISIFENNQANNSRPNKRDLRFAVECKNHAKLSSLKGETRKYLGLIADLAIGAHGNAGCIHCGIGFLAYFATPLNAISNHTYLKYLTNYHLISSFGFAPNKGGEKRFIKQLKVFYNGL